MNIPKNNPIPDDPDSLPPARRRRFKRLLAPLDDVEKAASVDELASRSSSSFDFFLFSLLCGLAYGAGLLLDSPAILLLAALLSPLMAPIIGMSLGTVIGSGGFFLRSLGGLLIGAVLVLGCGALAGLASLTFPPAGLDQAFASAQLTWINLLVLALGAIFTAGLMVRGETNAVLPSVALSYGLYLPLCVAGFGFTSRTLHLWPDGLLVFVIHLSWGVALGALVLVVQGFRPLTLFGYTVGGALALIGVVLAVGMSSAGAAIGAQIALPTFTPTATYTVTPTLTPTLTPEPPTLTPTITLTPITPTATITPTQTPTVTPTPVYALVVPADGAVVRDTPGGLVIASYTQGALLQILDINPTLLNGRAWLLIQGPNGQQGWILQTLLATPTPIPTQ